MKSPGPGAYEQKTLLSNNISYKIGSGNRSSLGQENKLLPGPGAYDTKLNTTRHQSSSWKFGSGTRSGLNMGESAKNPGPGSYDMNNNSKKIGVSFKGKVESDIKTTNSGPGPGNYTITTQLNKTS